MSSEILILILYFPIWTDNLANLNKDVCYISAARSPGAPGERVEIMVV